MRLPRPPARGIWSLLRYLWPQWRLLVVVVVALMLGIGLGLLTPWPTKVLIDNVLGDQPAPGWLRDAVAALPGPDGRRGLLLWMAIATVLIFALTAALQAARAVVGARLDQRTSYALGADVFMHVQRLSPLYHGHTSTGDLLARVTVDPSCVRILINEALLPAVQGAITTVAMFVIMFSLQPVLAAVALGTVPVMALAMQRFAGPMKHRNRRARDVEGEMMSLVEQTLTAIPVVQAFTREPRQHERFRVLAGRGVRAWESATALSMQFKFVIGLATAVGTAAIMYVGGVLVLEGELTVGSVVVFLAYLTALYGPLNSITYTGETLQYAAAQADRVLEVMAARPDVDDAPGARDVRLRGSVHYEDVIFGYQRDRPVLRNITLHAEPGEVVAIVGPTGAGKTTLVNMLMRYFDPWSGRVTIDGVDLRDMTIRTLREQVALVLQEAFLFPLSIRENIAYGRPGASDEEIVAAATAANADDFIRRLPAGYETVVGERGVTLSGGERQRLAIARAFLKDAPILVLDEPTSALDSRTEALLLEALERLMRGRLTLIVAHRLSTIRHADQILVLDDGRVIQRGRHAQLSESDGLYAELYGQQMQLAAHGTPAPVARLPEPDGRPRAAGGLVGALRAIRRRG
jgi:ATP-binding cassette subfamily B protein/subfamily B ATP-binding cassette protein MsbA